MAPSPAERIAQILYCPHAGSFSAAKLERISAHFRAQGYQLITTLYTFDDQARIAAPINQLVIMGGDGTIRHAIQHARNQGYAGQITIVSGGTINLLARNLKQLSPADAGHRPCYPALINDMLLWNCASIGPDAAAVAGHVRRLKQWLGRFSYVIAAAPALLAWKAIALHVRWPDGQLDCEAIYLAKSRYFAGPWSISERACTTQPVIHAVALRRCRRRDFLLFAASLIFRTQWGQGNIVRLEASDFTITADRLVDIQIDGDADRLSTVHIRVPAEPILIRALSIR